MRAVLARLLDGSRFQEFKAQVTIACTAGTAGSTHTQHPCTVMDAPRLDGPALKCVLPCTAWTACSALQYGKTLVTGFGSLYGMPVGIVANNGA